MGKLEVHLPSTPFVCHAPTVRRRDNGGWIKNGIVFKVGHGLHGTALRKQDAAAVFHLPFSPPHKNIVLCPCSCWYLQPFFQNVSADVPDRLRRTSSVACRVKRVVAEADREEEYSVLPPFIYTEAAKWAYRGQQQEGYSRPFYVDTTQLHYFLMSAYVLMYVQQDETSPTQTWFRHRRPSTPVETLKMVRDSCSCTRPPCSTAVAQSVRGLP